MCSAGEAKRMTVIAWVLPAALTSVAFVYGCWALIAKAALAGQGVNPLVLATYRCFGGALVMLWGNQLLGWAGKSGAEPSTASRGLGAIAAEHRPRVVLLGLLMSCNIGGNLLALERLPALTVSVFQPLLPIVASVASALLGIETLTVFRAVGITLASGGAVVVVVMGARHGEGHDIGRAVDGDYLRGLPCLMLNVCGGGLYVVLQKAVVHLYPPALVASAAFFVAAVVLLLGALCTAAFDPLAWRLGDSGGALFALLFSVFLTTAYNYTVLAWATRESSPATVTSFQTLQPVAAALMSWLVLHQGLTPGHAIGGAAIVLGLFFFASAPVPKLED